MSGSEFQCYSNVANGNAGIRNCTGRMRKVVSATRIFTNLLYVTYLSSLSSHFDISC
jgi:hypothetical protein